MPSSIALPQPRASVSAQQTATVDALERLLTWARRIKPTPGLSSSTYTTLDTLAFAGPLRITDLVEREGITQPGMTGLINRLEGEGLAIRSADPSDGRASLVSITDAGVALLAARRADRAAVISARLGELDDADRAALSAALPALHHLTAA